MKFIGTILFVSAGLLNARAADDPRSVEATNLMEEGASRLNVEGNAVKLSLRPFEITTLRIRV